MISPWPQTSRTVSKRSRQAAAGKTQMAWCANIWPPARYWIAHPRRGMDWNALLSLRYVERIAKPNQCRHWSVNALSGCRNLWRRITLRITRGEDARQDQYVLYCSANKIWRGLNRVTTRQWARKEDTYCITRSLELSAVS